jgi:membrane-associated phospholipid phosphatase
MSLNLSAIRPLLPHWLAFLCLALALGVVTVLTLRGPTVVSLPSLLPTITNVAGLTVLLFVILWRPGLQHALVHRLATLIVGMIFLAVAWDLIRLLNHTTMALRFPLADDMLSRWDGALGLDWHAYFAAVAESPVLRQAMAWSYTSLTFLSFLTYLLICLLSDHRRSLYFLEVFTFTAVFCTLSGALFPARAAVAHYLGTEADLSVFPAEPGLYHLFSLDLLRSGQPVELVVDRLPGLVTFPSFHTAAGVLLVLATWRSLLFLPATGYALLMISSTPVYGGHYFVDLIAGTLVALAIALPWAWRPKYRPLFSPKQAMADAGRHATPDGADPRGSAGPSSR